MSATNLIPAATILLLRDGADGLEVFMVVRHHQIDFASGALVFPGGKLDANDRHEDVPRLSDGMDGLTPLEQSVRAAAIREAFEESGVLLARDVVTGGLVSAARLKELERHREPLNRGDIGIADFLRSEKLRLAADLLVPFAHWIAPEIAVKRFDTYFYLALAPHDHVAAHDGYESVDSFWIRPEDALKDQREGKRIVIFPTRMVLGKLAQSKIAAEALMRAKSEKIVTVAPIITTRADGERVLSIPEEAGFGRVEELLSRI